MGYSNEDAHFSAFSADDETTGLHEDINALAMTEDPIEKQRRNKSQKPFPSREKKLKDADYTSKDLNNFMLEPWVLPEFTTENASGKTSTSTAA